MNLAPQGSGRRRLRFRLYRLLEAAGPGNRPGQVLEGCLILLIAANVVAVVLETVPDIGARYATQFKWFEWVSVALFTVEYLTRLWVAPEHPPYRALKAGAARGRHMLDPYMVIDLLAILPFYLQILIGVDLRILRLFRIIRFFKLVRYSAGLRSLLRAIRLEWRALVASLVVILGLLLTAAALLHIVEGSRQPEAFGSIPAALWWAVVTLTTVGYGDVVPITVLGRTIAGFVMLGGLAMFALPLGIVASAFAHEVHRREFVVTWEMVARVPLFANLDAEEISLVMKLLHAQRFPAGAIIARRGDIEQSLCFVAAGSVEMIVNRDVTVLEAGDFFGEASILDGAETQATYRARTACQILILDSEDLQRLMGRQPEIGESIRAVAIERFGSG